MEAIPFFDMAPNISAEYRDNGVIYGEDIKSIKSIESCKYNGEKSRRRIYKPYYQHTRTPPVKEKQRYRNNPFIRSETGNRIK